MFTANDDGIRSGITLRIRVATLRRILQRSARPATKTAWLPSDSISTSRVPGWSLVRVATMILAFCAAAFVCVDNTRAADWPADLPDPCVSSRYPDTLEFLAVGGSKFQWNVVHPSQFAEKLDGLNGIAFIVNGNGFDIIEYHQLAKKIARQGYVVRIIKRPSGDLEVGNVRDEMFKTVAMLGLPQNFPVVLIGHSRGGGSVMMVARDHQDTFNIAAVIGIAPQVEGLTGNFDVGPAFLALYGSQDEDVTGTGPIRKEAFLAYDIVNRAEGTSASPVNRVIRPNAYYVDKAMVYVRGADHAGFVRHEGAKQKVAFLDYLSPDNQSCIGNAYINAFLEWKIGGDVRYRDMFYGHIVPPVVQNIVTAKADYFGNPAGESLALFHQLGPKQRFVIENFEAATSIKSAPSVEALAIQPHFLDKKARHETTALVMAWKTSPMSAMTDVMISPERGKLANFDRLQLRIGQINVVLPEYANTDQTEPTIAIALVDSKGKSSIRFLNDYGSIPGHDMRSGPGLGHSHMNTIAIPIQDFSHADLSDIRSIRFWVLPKTKGAVMIDSIEAVYDEQ